MKYYKDSEGNVFAYSDEKNAKGGLTEITESEAISHSEEKKKEMELIDE